MTRFSRMDKKCRCSGAGQRGGDLAGNVSRLADAADNNAPPALQQNADRLFKPRIKMADQGSDGLGLDFKDFPGRCNCRAGRSVAGEFVHC